ncbi:hypothetical protein M8J76_007516 [Diaphorina citri]|nr:hypothetical protein M8J76_007516 [Diaphorina citri]
MAKQSAFPLLLTLLVLKINIMSSVAYPTYGYGGVQNEANYKSGKSQYPSSLGGGGYPSGSGKDPNDCPPETSGYSAGAGYAPRSGSGYASDGGYAPKSTGHGGGAEYAPKSTDYGGGDGKYAPQSSGYALKTSYSGGDGGYAPKSSSYGADSGYAPKSGLKSDYPKPVSGGYAPSYGNDYY